MAEIVRRYKDFNLTQLRVFCEFLRQGSFANAAHELGLSHSAVWQQVRALEQRFGVVLLHRLGRSWRPTEDGEALLDLVAGVLQSVDALDEAFRRIRGDLPRDLRVIATPGAATGELAKPIAALRRQHPRTRVEIVLASSTDQAVEELLSGQSDLALLTAGMVGSLHRRALEIIPVRERSPGVIVPLRHALTRRSRLELAELATFPLIVPNSNAWRDRCYEVFRAAGLWDALCIAVEVGLSEAIAEYVRRGVGVGLLALVGDWRPGPGLCMLPAGHLFPSNQLLLLRRRGKPRPQAALLEELLLAP